MQVNVYNDQKDLIISQLFVKKQVKALLAYLCVFCNEISIHFVSQKKISDLHKQYFKDPSPTDCISFPIDFEKDPKQTYRVLGEVFVCPNVAIQYAKNHEIDPLDETLLYMIHGILHLVGYDDKNKKQQTDMQKKEKSCMKLLRSQSLGLSKKHVRQMAKGK